MEKRKWIPFCGWPYFHAKWTNLDRLNFRWTIVLVKPDYDSCGDRSKLESEKWQSEIFHTVSLWVIFEAA